MLKPHPLQASPGLDLDRNLPPHKADNSTIFGISNASTILAMEMNCAPQDEYSI